ncbi:chaperone NapD [Shewanella submarina]|uniref:Chaperone NapD n=2 Tax=Shewanella submarina TaxID=2016376 RepID=A0ABV7G6T3_9GAMM
MQEVHISSLVVHTAPEHIAGISEQINAIPNAEVWGDNPKGKIVVVLESETQGFLTETIEKINNLPNVLGTALVYHQFEPTSDQLNNGVEGRRPEEGL